jgi:hypothetical protein
MAQPPYRYRELRTSAVGRTRAPTTILRRFKIF